MAVYLGIDTSNYTTSTALFDSEAWAQGRPWRSGWRKSCCRRRRERWDCGRATRFLPMSSSWADWPDSCLVRNRPLWHGVGVSIFPRRVEGSYMPCFLVGQMGAQLVSSAMGVPLYTFSHQEGHIAAALYSAGRLDLMKERFIAFHLSGGTTDALLVEPGEPFFKDYTGWPFAGPERQDRRSTGSD